MSNDPNDLQPEAYEPRSRFNPPPPQQPAPQLSAGRFPSVAETPTLEPFKRRNPWGWWLLSVITLGVGFIVWHYQINRDLAEANQRRHVSPGGAAAALTIGGLLIIPPYVTVFNTTDRIKRAQRDFGQKQTVGGGVTILLFLLFCTNFVYQQYALNRLVDVREGVN